MSPLPLPVNCSGVGAGQVEEPEVHRVLRVAEDEVGLAGAGRHLRRNLDRNRVGELGGRWPPPPRRRDPAPARPASPRLRRRRKRSRSTAAAQAAPAAGFLFLLRRHGQRRTVLPRLLRAHVVPSHEERDGVRVVNRLDGDVRRRRMERASGLHDLPDDRKAGHRRGGEARRALGNVDRSLHVPGDDEIGIARPVAPRQRVDEVRDRPSLLRASARRANDGIGVPLNPVLIVRKMSSRDEPPRQRPALREVRRRVSDGPTRPPASAPTVRRPGRACRGT